MTAQQIAAQHCGNYNRDGSCLGAVIEDDLQTRVCRPKPKCCVGTPGVRCTYFERCVAPMNHGDWPKLKSAALHQAFAEAFLRYERAAKIAPAKARVCVCGRELEPRHRKCYQCQQKARRKTFAAYNKKGRVRVPQLTQSDSLQTAPCQVLTKA
jgi:hypothetical protein